MKRKPLLIISLIFIIALAGLGACAMQAPSDYPTEDPDPTYNPGGDEYQMITENPFIDPEVNPDSYFSINVNTAGYADLRSDILAGRSVDPDQVKIEEMINYFKYDYPEPTGSDPLSITTGLFDCPWNSEAQLLTIGLKAVEVDAEEINNNLVFLLDVSGSMSASNKLPLMQEAFSLLVENLKPTDRVSIVTYAGSNKVLLRGCLASEKDEILEIINNLSAGGSTAGAGGIVTAYELAEEYFIEGGNNRVILGTDGDFNVGVSTTAGLEQLISAKRDTGIYLSLLGFGYGNLKDNKLETLANNGNGNYAYIDNINEARKVLVEEIGGTFYNVARDVKAYVEFNPAKVSSYRLLGYENSLLTEGEWEEDSTDAGEIGSGFTLTAVYEVVLGDSENENTMPGNYCKVCVRYKSPEVGVNTVMEMYAYGNSGDYTENPTEDMLFISALIETALILRDSEYAGDASLLAVQARLNSLESVESDPYRAEFKDMVDELAGGNYWLGSISGGSWNMWYALTGWVLPRLAEIM